MTDAPKNAPKGLKPLKGPMVVRHREAARFLWGDGKSGEVADVIYGRNIMGENANWMTIGTTIRFPVPESKPARERSGHL